MLPQSVGSFLKVLLFGTKYSNELFLSGSVDFSGSGHGPLALGLENIKN